MNNEAYRVNTTSPIESTAARSRQRRFEAVVRAYSADLCRFGYWLCHDQVLVEDLVQETFLRAWNSLDSLRDTKADKGWLITILRRENARHFKRYRPKESDVDLDDVEARESGCDPSDAVMLRRAIAALPEAYRAPLLLQVLGGYTSYEIADRLGLSRGGVLTRVFRARQKLRTALAGGEETTVDR